MPFSAILAQDAAVLSLTRALCRGRVHHAYRFEGPPGVGKELAARALAQSLVCERPRNGLACRDCSACHRAVTLTEEEPIVPLHPDVVFVQRGLYPPKTLGASHEETTGIGVDQIRRVVLGRIGFGPHEGRALVFIVRDAEELTLQAANALLKTLEEPTKLVHFILLSSRPRRLIDTVRSRTLAIRFAPLPQPVIAQILHERGLPTSAAALCLGSASLAIELADAEAMAAREAFVSGALAALEAPDLASALDAMEARPTDRGILREQLGYLAQRFAETGRQEAQREAFAESALEPGDGALSWAKRHAAVVSAMNDLDKNASPALTLEAMLARIRA